MGKNTSVSLGEHFDNFIANKISSGRYVNASEVIREGLRLLEKEEGDNFLGEWDKESLLKEIKKGEESGFVKNFNPQQYLKQLHEEFNDQRPGKKRPT